MVYIFANHPARSCGARRKRLRGRTLRGQVRGVKLTDEGLCVPCGGSSGSGAQSGSHHLQGRSLLCLQTMTVPLLLLQPAV